MLFDKKTIHFILPLVSLLKVFFFYQITAYVHLGLPSLWFVEAVLRHGTGYLLTAISFATVVKWHKWSLFSACAPLGTTCSLCKRVCPHQQASANDEFGSFFPACAHLSTSCSLCKRVCPHQLASSSDLFRSFFCFHVDGTCEWNSQQLTEYVTHTLLSWLQGGISLPFSSVLPQWHESLFLLNEGILGGPWCSPPPLYPHFSNVWASLRADC